MEILGNNTNNEKDQFMNDKSNFYPKEAKIKIIGVGGAGGNIVKTATYHFNNHLTLKYQHIDIIAANTDAQALKYNHTNYKIKIGGERNRGLGAGGNPEEGKKAALESWDEIEKYLLPSDLVIITGGMGGGTGTGAIPVIAEKLKQVKPKPPITLAVVTKPFTSEGEEKARIAEEGIKEIKKHIDAIITIPNDRILKLDPSITSREAYKKVDEVLVDVITGITDVIATPSDINVDFADIESILTRSGTALVGIGRGKGENKHIKAIKSAIEAPLIENVNIQNSKGIIVYFKCNPNIKAIEENEVKDYIQKKVANPRVKFKYGTYYTDQIPEDEITIVLIATGFGFENDEFIFKIRGNSTILDENINIEETEEIGLIDEKIDISKPAYLRKKGKVSYLD
jgi:cell division protein FtsZ